jgi:hypothetical protein
MLLLCRSCAGQSPFVCAGVSCRLGDNNHSSIWKTGVINKAPAESYICRGRLVLCAWNFDLSRSCVEFP